MLILAQLAPWATALLVAVFLLVCVLMILAVLIQRPSGGGLSGAFGSGAGSGQTAFGAKTGDALTIATIAIFFTYLLFAIGLNFAARPGKERLPVPPAATGTTAPGAQPEAAPEAATGATGPTQPEALPAIPAAPTLPPEGSTGATGTTPPPAQAPTGGAPAGSTGGTGPG